MTTTINGERYHATTPLCFFGNTSTGADAAKKTMLRFNHRDI